MIVKKYLLLPYLCPTTERCFSVQMAQFGNRLLRMKIFQSSDNNLANITVLNEVIRYYEIVLREDILLLIKLFKNSRYTARNSVDPFAPYDPRDHCSRPCMTDRRRRNCQDLTRQERWLALACSPASAAL